MSSGLYEPTKSCLLVVLVAAPLLLEELQTARKAVYIPPLSATIYKDLKSANLSVVGGVIRSSLQCELCLILGVALFYLEPNQLSIISVMSLSTIHIQPTLFRFLIVYLLVNTTTSRYARLSNIFNQY